MHMADPIDETPTTPDDLERSYAALLGNEDAPPEAPPPAQRIIEAAQAMAGAGQVHEADRQGQGRRRATGRFLFEAQLHRRLEVHDALFDLAATQRQLAIDTIAHLDREDLWGRPIVTEVVDAETFYPAEEYHQEFFKRNPTQGYCMAVVNPKLSKFRKQFASRLKSNAT